jgi:hypothetical protein
MEPSKPGQKDERIVRLEDCLRVIIRTSCESNIRNEALMALAGDPRKRD